MNAAAAQEKTTYDSVLAAKYLMAIACEKGQCLNVTKVQKLLYIAYGIGLAKHKWRIVSESPQAWPFGPVFPRTQKLIDYNTVFKPQDEIFESIRIDDKLTNLFSNVVDKYSGFSASKLSDWSHVEGSPWHKTTLIKDFKWSTPIPDDYIIEYFHDLSV